jgi:hypothetical protein
MLAQSIVVSIQTSSASLKSIKSIKNAHKWTQVSSHIGGTARGWATPPLCEGCLWPLYVSSSDLWKLPGKIRLQELVSSNFENISCVAFLKHKNSRKQGTGTVATC